MSEDDYVVSEELFNLNYLVQKIAEYASTIVDIKTSIGGIADGYRYTFKLEPVNVDRVYRRLYKVGFIRTPVREKTTMEVRCTSTNLLKESNESAAIRRILKTSAR